MAINWSKVGKWAAISIPVILGGGYLYAQSQKNKAASWGNEQQIPASTKDVVNSSNNKFPLKNGVKNNDYVKVLQSALGVVVDGWFGSKTLAALQLKANVSQINSLEELNSVIEIINQYNNENKNSDDTKTRVDRILELLYGVQGREGFVGGDHSSFSFNKDSVVQQIVYNNINNAWEKNGTITNMKKGYKFTKNDVDLMKGDDFNGDGLEDLVGYFKSKDKYWVVNSNDIDVN